MPTGIAMALPGGVRRAGAPALRPRRPARAVDREHARAPSTPATAARSRCCWSTTTRPSRSSCAAATGSPSWSSSGSSRRAFVEVDELPESRARGRRLRFYRRFRGRRPSPRPRGASAREVPSQGAVRRRRATDRRRPRRRRRGARPTPTDPRADGPFDVRGRRSPTTTVERVDLGAPADHPSPSRELQLQVDEADGQVVQSVMLAGPDGALELRAFAAPRNGDLWSEVRPQIAAEVAQRAAPPPSARAARAPSWSADGRPAPDGGRASSRPRVIGINGPRWLLRATLLGAPGRRARRRDGWEERWRTVVVRRGDARDARRATRCR